jgi:hypothetical protein
LCSFRRPRKPDLGLRAPELARARHWAKATPRPMASVPASSRGYPIRTPQGPQPAGTGLALVVGHAARHNRRVLPALLSRPCRHSLLSSGKHDSCAGVESSVAGRPCPLAVNQKAFRRLGPRRTKPADAVPGGYPLLAPMNPRLTVRFLTLCQRFSHLIFGRRDKRPARITDGPRSLRIPHEVALVPATDCPTTLVESLINSVAEENVPWRLER